MTHVHVHVFHFPPTHMYMYVGYTGTRTCIYNTSILYLWSPEIWIGVSAHVKLYMYLHVRTSHLQVARTITCT